MKKLIEGFWDCKYCGTQKNRGRIRECPNCGRPRDENTKFYMPDTITYVSEEKSKTINRNPDWICPYCNSLNSDSNNICDFCGSARTSENLDYFSINEKSNSSSLTTIEENSMKDDTDGTCENNIMKNIIIIPSSTHRKILLILTFIIGMIFLFTPKNEEISITKFSWERSIEIEKYQTVEENGWDLPSGARLHYTNVEFSHYQSVFDHYETKTRQVAKERIAGYEDYVMGYRDLGNGYFEEILSQRPIYETYYETETYQEAVYRDEPVYLTKYYYEIDKWLYARSIVTKASDKNPKWGEVILDNNERISNKVQKYYITGINSKEEEKIISLDYDVWNQLNINETVKLKVSLFGHGELIN